MLVSEKHKDFFSVDKDSADVVRCITEEEVLEKISHFDIPVYSMRTYCLKKGLCKRKRQGLRQKYEYQYKEDFVNELADNWTSMEMALKKVNVSQSVLYAKLKQQKVQTLKIGKLLIKTQDLIQRV